MAYEIPDSYYLTGRFCVKFNECRKTNQYTDLILKVGKTHFAAHRIVLRIMSPVLENHLSQISSAEDAVLVLDKQFIDEVIVEDLLQFLYTAEVTLTPKNIESFIVASKYLKVESLSWRCNQYLTNNFSDSNALQTYLLAQKYEIDLFFREYISNHRYKVLKSTDFSSFSAENLKKIVIDLSQLCGSTLFLGSKDPRDELMKKALFEAVIKWAEHDCPARLLSRSTLLRLIPLNELPREFVLEFFPAENGPIRPLSYYKFLSNVLNQIIQVSEMERLYACSDRNLLEFETFNSRWQEVKTMNSILPGHFGCASIGNRIYIGAYRKNRSNAFESLDCSTKEIKALRSLPQSRRGFAVSSLNGNIYVTGGAGKVTNSGQYYERSASVFRYDPRTDQWETLSDMNVGRIDHELVQLNGLLYAIGSEDSSRDEVKEVEEYDPSTDKWTIVTKIPGTLICAAAHRKRIHVYTDEGFHAYSPETRQWGKLPSLEQVYVDVNIKSLVSIGGLLYALAWKTDRISFFCYDVFTDEWQPILGMDYPGFLPQKVNALVVRPEEKIEPHKEKNGLNKDAINASLDSNKIRKHIAYEDLDSGTFYTTEFNQIEQYRSTWKQGQDWPADGIVTINLESGQQIKARLIIISTEEDCQQIAEQQNSERLTIKNDTANVQKQGSLVENQRNNPQTSQEQENPSKSGEQSSKTSKKFFKLFQ